MALFSILGFCLEVWRKRTIDWHPKEQAIVSFSQTQSEDFIERCYTTHDRNMVCHNL